MIPGDVMSDKKQDDQNRPVGIEDRPIQHMTSREEDQEFAAEMVRRSRRLIEDGSHQEAEHLLQEALKRVPDHKECRSYLAVALAGGQRKFVSAEKLAKSIIRDNPYDATAYYALGQVNLLGRRRGSAFRNLEKARNLASGDRGIERQVDSLDPRRPPVIRWLPRDNFLNILLGRWRASHSKG
jgi:tetratricopeptide (TPR) repeat protein